MLTPIPNVDKTQDFYVTGSMSWQSYRRPLRKPFHLPWMMIHRKLISQVHMPYTDVSPNVQYKDVYGRTIEILQLARFAI